MFSNFSYGDYRGCAHDGRDDVLPYRLLVAARPDDSVGRGYLLQVVVRFWKLFQMMPWFHQQTSYPNFSNGLLPVVLVVAPNFLRSSFGSFRFVIQKRELILVHSAWH